MADDKEIFGYRCPVCKTINSASAKNCYGCGHWLLDPDFPGEPLDKENYLRQVKGSKKNGAKEFSPKRFSIKKLFIGAAVVLVFLFIIGSLSSNQSNRQIVPEITPEEFKATAADIGYDELARNVEQYKNSRVHLIGKVVQVVENPPILRIDVSAATPDNPFPAPEVVWITRKDSAGRILENDTVEIWGIVKGPRTYKSVLGQAITIPEVESRYLEITQKAGEK